jgi:hypothetical protein
MGAYEKRIIRPKKGVPWIEPLHTFPELLLTTQAHFPVTPSYCPAIPFTGTFIMGWLI